MIIKVIGETCKWKDANQKLQVDLMNMIKDIHENGERAITSEEKESSTKVESYKDVTLKDGKRP